MNFILNAITAETALILFMNVQHHIFIMFSYIAVTLYEPFCIWHEWTVKRNSCVRTISPFQYVCIILVP